VNEALREVLSTAIGRGLKDPRIGFVTVTGVEATNDVREARVFVSILGTDDEKKQTLEGLRSAEGHLQSVISAELHFKNTPTLEFVYDDSVDRGVRISALIRQEVDRLPEEQPAELPEETAAEDANEWVVEPGDGLVGEGADQSVADPDDESAVS